MEKGQLWTIVGIALVVAVVASIVTASITGNVINVARGTAGRVYTTSETYSKTEVDRSLSNLNSQLRYGSESITWDMLVRLNKCEVVKDKQTNGVITCDTICRNTRNMICVLGEYQGTIRPCSDNAGIINTDRFCKCCGL